MGRPTTSTARTRRPSLAHRRAGHVTPSVLQSLSGLTAYVNPFAFFRRGSTLHWAVALCVLFAVIPLAVFLPVVLTLSKSNGTGDLVGFTAGANRRGTMDILYMCLSAMLSVAYAATNDDEHAARWIPAEFLLSPLATHTRKTIVGFLFPELLLFQAIIEFQDALLIRTELKQRGGDAAAQGGLVVGFFAAMMGFSKGGQVLTVEEFKALAVDHASQYDWSAIKVKIQMVGRYDPFVKVTTVL